MTTTTNKATILECGHVPSSQGGAQPGFGVGYGTDNDGNRNCYECCGTRDREQMIRDGKTILYLSYNEHANSPVATTWKITNWPRSLIFPVKSISFGRHNIARTRTDVWFMADGREWHGVQYGEDTQLLHCKRLV